MATFGVTTTAAQDAAIKYYAAQYNATTKDTMAPADFARMRIAQLLDRLADEYRDERARQMPDATVTKAEAYQAATPTDQAAVDAILAKYQ